jgi:flagellar biosynthetic protein FliR
MDGTPLNLQIAESGMFVVLAVFCRVGSAIMVLPGIGELNVPARIRLVFAILTSFVLAPVVKASYPAAPGDLLPFAGLLLGEITIGLALGLIIRMFLMALQVAGNVIASQTGLSFAQNFDPSLGVQGALLAAFLTILGITLILESDLHYLMIAGLKNSYQLLPPGGAIPWGDLADLAARTFSLVFRLGIQLAAPFIVFSLVFYAAAGAVAKLLPQIQIFFLSVPLSILGGFSLLMLIIGSLMLVFIDAYQRMLTAPWL